jgi:hypothetical protein
LTVPTSANIGVPLTNTNGVTMVNEPVSGFVFSFPGSNHLSLNLNQPLITQTRTFWLSSATANAGNGCVYCSNKYILYFLGGTLLKCYSNYEGGTAAFSNVSQGTTWVFYAMTLTDKVMNIYVNGNFVTSVANTWLGENSEIQFGGGNNYTGLIDDIRLYQSALTASQILDIYNGL